MLSVKGGSVKGRKRAKGDGNGDVHSHVHGYSLYTDKQTHINRRIYIYTYRHGYIHVQDVNKLE